MGPIRGATLDVSANNYQNSREFWGRGIMPKQPHLQPKGRYAADGAGESERFATPVPAAPADRPGHEWPVVPASASRFSCGDMPSRSSALRQAGMLITMVSLGLGDQIARTGGSAERHFDIEQVGGRIAGQHLVDRRGDGGGVA